MMLVPAGFLILMLFAGLAVDSAGAFLAQRQLGDALAAAANDAATAGLNNRAYYDAGSVTLDPALAAVVVCDSLAAQSDTDLHHLVVTMGVAGPVINLGGTAEVRTIFGRLIPHFGTREVRAQVSADAQQGTARSQMAPAGVTPLPC